MHATSTSKDNSKSLKMISVYSYMHAYVHLYLHLNYFNRSFAEKKKYQEYFPENIHKTNNYSQNVWLLENLGIHLSNLTQSTLSNFFREDELMIVGSEDRSRHSTTTSVYI